MLKKLILTVPLIALVFIAGCAPTPTNTAKSVEESLTCQCGCGLTVHTCNHLQCAFAVPVRREVRKRLDAGDAATAILDDFTTEYGEKVLSSPVPEGFNLLAWYGPYIALFSATILVLIVIRRWSRQLGVSGDSSSNQTEDAVSDSDRDRLARELEDYEP